MTKQDEDELRETLQLLAENPGSIVGLTISEKPYILLDQDTFQHFVNEINHYRVQMMNKGEEVELIVPAFDVEEEDENT